MKNPDSTPVIGDLPQPISEVDIHDRVMDAYYGQLGETFMKETQARIHWICAQVSGNRILDIGCSQGIVPILLAREGCQVIGVDSSLKAIKEASAFLMKEPDHVREKVTYVNEDFMTLDVSKYMMDTIVLSEVLEHLVRPTLFIKKAAELLHATRGRLIVTVPFGINEFIDHKQTFYLKGPHELLHNWFQEIDFVILGKWIGLVAQSPRKTSEQVEQAVLAPEIAQLEKGFYALESDLRQQIKSLTSDLYEANRKYRSQSEAYSKLKQELGRLESRFTAQTKELNTIGSELKHANKRFTAQTKELNTIGSELKHANQKRSEAQRAMSLLQASITYQAGLQFRKASGSFVDAIKLPLRLWRLKKKYTGKNISGALERTTARVSETVPSRGPIAIPAPSLNHIQSLNTEILAKKSITQVRMACIMDDFTFCSYAPECDLSQISPAHWEDELRALQPDLLFVESAWCGKDKLWASKVGHTSKELQDIVSWCRTKCIPTVFWNKEDPVHFEGFLNTARLFDFVFTTDIDCIHRYKAALGHDRVYFLPFACQPAAHNPVEKYERKDAFCFAGAYYVRYRARTRDLEDFVRELPSFRPFDIYDRNYGKDNPEYQFPETYQQYIVGTLSYHQIDKAYKGYRYAINLNSIKQSQTMFARRVYELLGSNTLVVSNYSRGVRLTFGDLVLASDSGAEIKRRLEALLMEGHTDRLRLAGLRKVMLEHTYGQRIAYVLSKVTGRKVAQPLPRFKVLASADTLEAAQRLIAQLQAQRGIHVSLSIVLTSGLKDDEVQEALTEPGFVVELLNTEALHAKRLGELADGADWLAGMVANDYYGLHYLLDIALATRYSDAQVIGKGAWHAWQQGQCTLNQPNVVFRPAVHLAARRSAITCTLAEDIDATQWLTMLDEWTYEYPKQLAIDPYNYCADAIQSDLSEIRETVDDLSVNHGTDLEELIGIAETMPPMQHQEIDTPYFNGRELAHLLAGKPFVLHTNHEALSTEEQVDDAIQLSRNKAIHATLSGSTLQIRSELPDDKHEYLYSPVDLGCDELLARLPESRNRQIPIHFEIEPGLNLSLVVLYLDAHKNHIGHVIEQPHRNRCIELPDAAAFLRFGLRVYAGGSARIKRLVLGHLDLEPQEVLGQSDVLLLTNHYPSYDDLYRNGFVHSRVRAYREHGVNVDVFRLRENQPIAWHEFQDIDVTTGSHEALRRLLASRRYRHVLVHFLDPDMWTVLRPFSKNIPITVWVHGAEVQPWWRRKYNYQTGDELEHAQHISHSRLRFWKDIFANHSAQVRFVFVSNYFAQEVMEDVGVVLARRAYEIIHNPVDTELFSYQEKSSEQRKRILSVRPYASRKYANDLSVEAVMKLSKEPHFNELEFKFIGDGPLFDETLLPIKHYDNVSVEKRFMNQLEIAQLHKEYGIFLCPTRMDSQGVSKDEAMSSGLVPITNAVAAIPEFVDESCAFLAPAEDSSAIAEAIRALYRDPSLFLQMSQNAATRARNQVSSTRIIGLELELLETKP